MRVPQPRRRASILALLCLILAAACAPAATPAPTAAPTAAPKPAATTPPAPAASPVAAASPAVGAGPAASPAAAASPAPASSPAAASASPAAVALGQVTPPPGATKVNAAYAQASSVQGVLYVAKEAGFFARNGLDVSLTMVQGPTQVPALVNNEIQFAALGANEVASANAGGSPVTLIATCSDLPIFSLYANKKYATVQDLDGQTIGVTSAGSATDAAAHLFLQHFNMLDKVKIVPAGGTIPAILAAMTQGVIAGGIVSPPTNASAEEAGFVELVNGAKLGVPMNHSAIAVMRPYLQQNGAVVSAFLKAYVQAWAFSADPANKATVLKVLEQYTRSDERLAQIGYDAIVPVWTGTKVPRMNPEAVTNLLALSDNPKVRDLKAEAIIDNGPIDAVAQ